MNKLEAASFEEKPVKKTTDLVDYVIRFPEVLLIGANGEQLGIKSRNEAIKIAELNNLNLVCVAPNAKPPVCKILNYGKFRYEKEKKAKEAKKNQKIVELKEVRFTPRTNLHDLETKAKATKKWLEEGAKVKVTVRFKGREMAHPEIGEETLKQFLELVKEFSTIDKPIQMEGYRMFAVISPIKKK